MKVLIACEYSGIVRDAFIKKGHNAVSCDLLPTESEGPHYQGSVLDIINDGWDLMIGHPPCTYLSFAANRYWYVRGRAWKRIEALSFFLKLWEAPINKICLENPMGCVDSIIEKHTQVIHPYYFGDSEIKRTCLWLKNLPPLKYQITTDLFTQQTAVEKPEPVYTDLSGKRRYRTDSISGTSKNGQKERARFFPSVAAAMAEQWGGGNIMRLTGTARNKLILRLSFGETKFHYHSN